MAGEWREIALWDIAEYINGRATKPSELALNGVPVIKIAELNRGITEETDRIPAELVEEKHWVSPGDLLFAWSGSVGIYRYAGPKAALNQHIFRVVARPGIDQGFLRYLLLSCMPLFHLHVQDKRTTMGHVTKKDLQRIRVRIPPLQEQRAIAHILGTLDDKIELNRRMSETLEAMARALFKAWFVDFEPVRAKMEGRWQRGQSLPGLPAHLYDLFPDRLVDSELGEIPEGWSYVELKDALEIADGRTLPPERRNDRGPFEVFGANGVIGRTDAPSVDSPCIILGKIGSCGSLHRSARPCWVSNNAFTIRAGRSVSLEFAWWVLRGIDFSQFVGGSANPYMPLKNFGHYRVLLPDTKLLHAFQVRAGACRQRIDAADDESRTLAALRDALLPKLIRGEIRVKDAERFLKETGLC